MWNAAMDNAFLREMMYGDDEFVMLLRRKGWHLEGSKLYADPQVIKGRWLERPNGQIETPEAAFYRLLSENVVRKLLRAIIARPRRFSELVPICDNEELLHNYLAFFERQEIITSDNDIWGKGGACDVIDNIGPTLEWLVAEWFRTELKSPARHGVTLKEIQRGGDLDVVAIVGEMRVMIECKTSKPHDILAVDLRWFLQRAYDFSPDIAILLIDTESSLAITIKRINEIITDMAWKSARLENPSLPDDANLAIGTIEAQNGFKDLYWGLRNIYVTNTHKNIDTALSSVLRLYDSRIKHHVILGDNGDTFWDYVNSDVSKSL